MVHLQALSKGVKLGQAMQICSWTINASHGGCNRLSQNAGDVLVHTTLQWAPAMRAYATLAGVG